MILSMTGFGRAECPIDDKHVTIEIKSLNGKQLDINCKIPAMLRPYEQEIRKIIQQHVVRGSVECIISIHQSGASKPMHINTEIAKKYYDAMVQLATDLNLPTENILSTLLNLPEVIAADDAALAPEQWVLIQQNIVKALEDLHAFRMKEGEMLSADLKQNTEIILKNLASVDQYDANRAIRIRERIEKALEDAVGVENIDKNRLEQELIYYIEKIDVSEEKTRLLNHCQLFLDQLNQNNEAGIGKKLNFVLQEMGREINTLGSKANDASIQKLVVDMKDALEKAKEQSLNVL